MADGLPGQVEPLGDLGATESFGNQGQYLRFPLGQAGGIGTGLRYLDPGVRASPTIFLAFVTRLLHRSASCDTLRASASTLAYAYRRENRNPSENPAEGAHAEPAPDPALIDGSIIACARPRRGRPGGHRQAGPRGLRLAPPGYVDPVYRYCDRCLGNCVAAEDATSLTFTDALAALASCRDDRFRSWLFTIAHNLIVDMRREQHPRTSISTRFLRPPCTCRFWRV